MSTEILHVSDTHLGYRQYHKSEREEDFRVAFERVIDEAIDRGVDAVVHAGDMFNRSRPSIGTLSAFVDQLQRLRHAGIEFCTIVGNHDGTRDRQWPEFFENLGLGTYLNYSGYIVGDVALYGQDHVENGQRDQIQYRFEEQDADYSMLVSHGLFTPFPHADWDTEEILAKSPVSFDALLFGDDHTPQIESLNGIPVTYPGSTERTAADQREARGFNIVSVSNGEVNISHETIETRDFQFIDLELDADQGVDAVINEVESREIIDGAVVVVTLTGDGKRVPSGDIEKVGLRDGALVVQVNDRREFEDVDPEFDEVTFADPDDAVRERKADLGLSAVADDFEQTARDIEGVPQSNLKDLTEERVSERLTEDGVDAFIGSETGSESGAGDSSNAGTQPPTDSQTHTGTGENPRSDAESDPGDEPGDDGAEDVTQAKQMQFDDIE